MSERYNADGPVVVWLDYGCEGWRPSSYDTVKEALLGERYGNRFVVTRVVKFEVKEKPNEETNS